MQQCHTQREVANHRGVFGQLRVQFKTHCCCPIEWNDISIRQIKQKVDAFTPTFLIIFSNLEPRTSNLEPRTSNLEPRTSNLEPRTSNLEPRTSNLEPLTYALTYRYRAETDLA
ncbi:hypothetical protein D8T27_13590 [Vibrio vulnificus]|nr:hypothetical protein D8T27_13590 [Vibrio vulnificus]